MHVKLFHEILLFPLLIEEQTEGDPREKLDHWVTCLKDSPMCWKPYKHPYERATADGQDIAYAEFVYFYPFVRRFLYGTRQNRAPLRIVKRLDVAGVRIGLSGKSSPPYLDLHVNPVHLYLFDTHIAILVVEVFGENLDLGDVLEVQDCLRHAYPPYWEKQPPAGGIVRNRAGHCPESVQWLDKQKQPIGRVADYEDTWRHQDWVQDRLQPPLAAHWKWLLKPLVPHGGGSGGLTFRQIEDERIPAMCYLALEEPQALTRGDFVRLTFLDGRGDSVTLPYGTSFLSDFEAKYCYNAFWDPHTPGHDWMSTRYLCSGYAFTMVGKDDRQDAENDFFTNPRTGALAHFRHHYLQMGIIAHFHKASLLRFSDLLSDAVATVNQHVIHLASQDAEAFRQKTQRIQMALLDFTQRYWFTEVSNQLQARELFAMWQRHLGTHALYQQVMEEVRTVNAVLDFMQQEQQTGTSMRLTIVATVGLVFALATSFFGMNIFPEPLPHSVMLFLVGTLVSALVLLTSVICSERLARALSALAQEELPLRQRLRNAWNHLRH